MWPVFTAQSVTLMGRASIKSRFSLLLINTRPLKASFHSVCAQSFLRLRSARLWGHLVGQSARRFTVSPTYRKQCFLLHFYFFCRVFLLPLILHPVSHVLSTGDSFAWSPPHRSRPCRAFLLLLERREPGPTAWPAAPAPSACRSAPPGRRAPGRAQERFLGSTLPCRRPWLQPLAGMARPPSASALTRGGTVHTTPRVEPGACRNKTWEVSHGLGPSPV